MSQDGASVLLVDDSLTVRMDLSEALQTAGLAVTPCINVAQARATLAQGGFGLVILDVLLPDGDGVELLEEIRETPSLAGVAVILLSDEAAVRDRIRGLVTGADEYIGKPYDARYVVASAQELLRRGSAQEASTQPSVLVIDDSPTFCAHIKETLKEAGYRVLSAGSGEAGLRLAAATRPDAIMVDRVLPGMDGVAVLRGIRMDAALRQIPCILLTASEEKHDEVAALDAGADAFVRKDGDTAILLARLAAVLRHAGGARAVGSSLQGPKRILVVDGDENYLRETISGLRDAGYEMVRARSGEEAFDMLSAQPVECILLAINLPGIGACETCRRIKSVSFASATPIIVTGASDDRDAVLRCLEAGADDTIGKDEDAAVLRARVLAQIRRRQFEDENRLFQEELGRKEAQTAEARATQESGEMRERALERCRAQLALAQLSLRLARGARWAAMNLAAATLDGEIAAALGRIGTSLGHACRCARSIPVPQGGHLVELLEQASGQSMQVSAAIAAFRAALELPQVQRSREDINSVVREIAVLGTAAGWGTKLKLNLSPSLPVVAINRELIQQVLLVLIGGGLEVVADSRRREIAVSTQAGAGTVLVTVTGDRPAVCEDVPAFDSAGESLDLAICGVILAAHGGRLWTKQAATSFELPAGE